MAILGARRENMHVNLHCGVCATLKLFYTIASVAQVSLANQATFLCNQDVRARMTGCKRGLRAFRD